MSSLSRRAFNAIVGGILIAHVALLVDGALRNFIVVDEAAHVPAGILCWKQARFDIYCVNPPLTRLLATLPTLAVNPVVDLGEQPFSASDRPEWNIARRFPASNARHFLTIFRVARLSGIAWSVIGAILIGRWARELYGDEAAVLGTALWCFFPTVMAFGQVVTPDVPASVAGLAAAYAFWKYRNRPTISRALGSGLLLGLAESTKFTLLSLYLIWALAGAAFRDREPVAGRGSRVGLRAFGHAMVILVVSLVVINLMYGFHGTARTLSEFTFYSEMLSGESPLGAGTAGNRFRGSPIGSLPVPLPEDFVQGIDLQRRDFESGLPSYLGGEWHRRGWWYYYLYAAAIKVPLGMLVLVVWGCLGLFRRRDGRGSAEALLALHAFAIFVFVSSQTGFSHHFRYVLPAFPFLILIACSLAKRFEDLNPIRKLLIAACSMWCVAAGSYSHPHSMSNFNEVVGGSAHGDEHLVDSNIDWGQDLLFLKSWLVAHPGARPIGLAYYNILSPKLVGIDFELPPRAPTGLFSGDRSYQSLRGPHAGYFAVSVNHLRGAEFEVPDREGRHWLTHRGDFEYFRLFRPIAKAGESIRIYHLTDGDVARARQILQAAEQVGDN